MLAHKGRKMKIGILGRTKGQTLKKDDGERVILKQPSMYTMP